METNPLKMKPYYLSTFTESLKTPSCKTMPQWSFKKTMSKWTSMPGCTIQFRAETDPILAQHLAKSSHNAQYTSKTIQNELVEVIGGRIRNDI